jgi:hypothetical protein
MIRKAYLVAFTIAVLALVGGPAPAPANSIVSTAVPEPITMFLGGIGLMTLGYGARRRLFRHSAGGRLARRTRPHQSLAHSSHAPRRPTLELNASVSEMHARQTGGAVS